MHECTSILSTAVRCRAGDINGVENEDMTDLEKAKSMLADDCNLAVVKGGSVSRFSESGIKACLVLPKATKNCLTARPSRTR